MLKYNIEKHIFPGYDQFPAGSTTGQIFCIRHMLEKKCEYNETVHQLFIDFKKACDSVRRAILYKILIEFDAPIKLVQLKCV
jgi:hypothetical protein